MSVGGIEVVILAVVFVMLFGPALFAFWLGYTMGKRRAEDDTHTAGTAGSPTSDSADPLRSDEQPDDRGGL